MVGAAGEDEEKVREAVQVNEGLAAQGRGPRGLEQAAFGPAGDGARQVQGGGAGRAAGQHEGLERLEALFGLVDGMLESGRVALVEQAHA